MTFPTLKVLSAAAAVSALTLGSGAAQESGESSVRVSHRARALAPGEVVVLSAGGPVPFANVEGTALGRDVVFVRGDRPEIWRAVIGIDLDVEPGVYEVEVSATGEDGRATAARHVLEVQAKAFPTRRLSVDPRFVTPPAEVEARIVEEARLMSDALARSTPRQLWEGPFAAPVPGAPNSSFGTRSVFNGQPRSPHTGADYPVGTGTPVAAPANGTVVLARDLYFAGNTVVVDHGVGVFSLFAHLSRIGVSEGQSVSPGDVLGLVGATGRVTGPHLHWAIRVQGARVDPLSLLEALAE